MNDPAHYEIRVKGHLSDQWVDQFGGLVIDNLSNGVALLSGLLPDQAALHGVLNRILYLGLTLMSLNRTELANPKGLDEDDHARIQLQNIGEIVKLRESLRHRRRLTL